MESLGLLSRKEGRAMKESKITFVGQPAKIACDEKCDKAWGINLRPKNQLSNDPDDYEWLSGDELGFAPVFPGIYEGGHTKPRRPGLKHNKWCVRECERLSMSDPGQDDHPLELEDFSIRIKNIGG